MNNKFSELKYKAVPEMDWVNYF